MGGKAKKAKNAGKKAAQAAQAKAEAKRRARTVEDKTFGLKNKKRSSKVQKYIQNVKQTVQQGAARSRRGQVVDEVRGSSGSDSLGMQAPRANNPTHSTRLPLCMCCQQAQR